MGTTVPAHLILHLGANDVTQLTSWQWYNELEIAILYLRVRYPHTRIVWSDMLPRKAWRHASSIVGPEKARKRNQRRARALVCEQGGYIIKHPRIGADDTCLIDDGVHLTNVGQERFRNDLEQGIMEILKDPVD